MLSRFRLAESPPHFNMAVCELKIPCSKLQGMRSLSRFSRWGASGHCPAGGTTSTERVNGIFLEETKRTRLAIVADLRRGHCIGGLILGGSKLPLTLHAGDAPGVFRSGTRPGLAHARAPHAAISLPFW